MSLFPAPAALPPLHVPASNNVVRTSVIHTGARVQGVPLSMFFKPPIKGYDVIDCPSYSFLVEHEASGTKVLFDLGVSKSWKTGPPEVAGKIIRNGWQVDAPKDVADVLIEHGVPPDSIKTVIWSHWHWDHVGDPTTFPTTTSLTVGPGFKAEMLPGYPANPLSPVLESAWEGRELVEISFDQTPELRIGRFRALDYFGDGSFYLLDSPGHATGHICGLARTTPDTFVFMGGDICHHGGQLRPTQYLPLPAHISPNPFSNMSHTSSCPGSLLLEIHPEHSAAEPFLQVAEGGFSSDPAEAQSSLNKLGEVDGHDNVFTVIAHDTTLLDVLDFFPKTLNGWKAEGLREQGMWRFLKDFEGAIESTGVAVHPIASSPL